MSKEEDKWRLQEKWHLEVYQPKNDEVYKNAKYVIDFRGGTLKAQAFGYFCKDWDLKLEAIELVKMYIEWL